MSIATEQLSRPNLDAAVSRLVQNKQRWAQTSLAERISILTEIKDRVLDVAEDWALTASAKKQIPKGLNLRLTGRYRIAGGLRELIAGST